MSAGACFPVNGAVVVALHILLYLLEVGVVPHSANPLNTQFLQVIAHGEQFILSQHEIGRIYLDVARRLICKPPAYESQPDESEGAYIAEPIHATLLRLQTILYGGVSLCLHRCLEANVASLEYERYLVDNLHAHFVREGVSKMNPNHVVVAIREAVAARTSRRDSASPVEHSRLGEHESQEERKQHLAHHEERRKPIASGNDSDYSYYDDIESAS